MSLVKNVLNVGIATAASRVLGFVRDVFMANYLGAGAVTDAFVVAFRLPNLFRRLFAEGAFNSAFVPLFAKRMQESEDSARLFAQETLAVMLWWVAGLSILLMLAMQPLVWVLAPGFAEDPEKFNLTVLFSLICFPYLLCMSLLALYGGILNSRGRFTAAAWAPVLLNIIMCGALILAGLLGYGGTPQAGFFLSWGVCLAGFAQLGLIVVAAHKSGMALKIQAPRMTANVRRVLALGIPGLIAGGITQINLVIGTIIASNAPAAVSRLYYADRIYQFPLGMVGVAIGVVLLPELSRQLKAQDPKLHDTQNRALEFSMLLTLPAAVALMCVATSIITGLFERGAFGAADTAVVASALAAFGWGLPAFVLIKVLSPAFFAREDTKRPMLFAIISVAVNVVGSLLLFPDYGAQGIAVATSLAGWVNALLLAVTLWRMKAIAPDKVLLRRLAAIMLACALMAASLLALSPLLMPYLGAAEKLSVKLLALAALCGAGFLVYALSAYILGGVDRAAIRDFLGKRKIRKGEAPPAMDV